jgi:hypothetical protein
MCSLASELVFGNIIINLGDEGRALDADSQVDRQQLASGNRALGMHWGNNGGANYAFEYK